MKKFSALKTSHCASAPVDIVGIASAKDKIDSDTSAGYDHEDIGCSAAGFALTS